MRQRNSLALVPSEHNLAFLVVPGLEGGHRITHARHRRGRTRELATMAASWRIPTSPTDFTKRKWPLTRLRLLERWAGAAPRWSCTASGDGSPTAAPSGDRCPDVAPGIGAAPGCCRGITQEVPNPLPGTVGTTQHLPSSGPGFSAAPQLATKRASTRSPGTVGSECQDPEDLRRVPLRVDGTYEEEGTRHEPRWLLWRSRYELGRPVPEGGLPAYPQRRPDTGALGGGSRCSPPGQPARTRGVGTAPRWHALTASRDGFWSDARPCAPIPGSTTAACARQVGQGAVGQDPYAIAASACDRFAGFSHRPRSVRTPGPAPETDWVRRSPSSGPGSSRCPMTG